MYLNHHHLNEKPFEMSPDPRFLWLGEKHKEALAALEYGILESKGFLLLTGEPGTGKTVLINALMKSTRVKAIIATIPDPDLEILDFFNFLSDEFQMNKTFETKGAFLIEFKQFLHQVYQSEGKVLLIVDEAQRLNHELLEQIRILSNIELDNRKLINIFFVGQSEFDQILREERNVAIRKRIAVSYNLDLLQEEETASYINHRLNIAGATRDLFTLEAIRNIYQFSGGLPRLINIICDHALLTGYSKGLKRIDANVIAECKKDLFILTDSHKLSTEEKPEDKPVEAVGQVAAIPKPPVKQRGAKRIWIYLGFVLAFAIFGYFIFNPGWIDFLGDENKESLPSLKSSPPENESLKSEDVLTKESGDQEAPQRSPIQSAAVELEPAETEKEPALAPVQSSGQTATAVAETKAAETEKESDLAPIQSTDQTTTEAAQLEPDEIKKEAASPPIQKPGQTAETADLKSSGHILFFPERKTIIQFEHNSMRLSEQARAVLDEIVIFSSDNPTSEIVVEGYTDSQGDYVYNKNLSKWRADVVKQYLVNQGLSPSRIGAYGMGPENPIASNETFEGRKLNRRIEISVKF